MSGPRSAYEVLGRSVYLLHVDSGSCNGCDIEVLDALTPYFDVERFGVKLVASPKHADAVIVTGPVTRQFSAFLKRVYQYLPKPTVIIACGSCACGGGIWHDTYSTLGGVDKVVPVDTYIPGCPPRPSAIIHGVLVALGVLQQKVRRVEKSLRPSALKTLRPPTDYLTYKEVLNTLKRMLGYRLAGRVLKNYLSLLERGVGREEAAREAAGGDERVEAVLKALKEVVGGGGR